MVTYLVTGTFKGRPYSRETTDYEFAVQLFSANNFKYLWQVDHCRVTGERLGRKLINKNRDTK